MLIFLYGLDTYRSKQNLDKIIGEYRRKYSSGLNFYSFDFSESPSTGRSTLRVSDSRSAIADFENAVKSHSFFNEKKLILLRNSFTKNSSKKAKEIIDEQDLTKNKDVVVIIYEKQSQEDLEKMDKAFFKTLFQYSKPRKEFKSLTNAQLKKWVSSYLKNHSLNIKSSALNIFCERGADLNSQRLELDKLMGYALINGIQEITEKEISLLIADTEAVNIFELLDAISEKQRFKALLLIENSLKNGQDPAYLFSMIVYQIRNLLIVKDLVSKPLAYDSALKKSGLHPFVFKKASRACEKINIETLKDWYAKLGEFDIKIKSGMVDIESALLNIPLVCTI